MRLNTKKDEYFEDHGYIALISIASILLAGVNFHILLVILILIHTPPLLLILHHDLPLILINVFSSIIAITIINLIKDFLKAMIYSSFNLLLMN